MTDVTTQQRLHVSTEGTAGPYILLPVSQLEDVKRLLDRDGIFYWVEENFISINGAPATAVIDLGRNGDAQAVQAILDSVR